MSPEGPRKPINKLVRIIPPTVPARENRLVDPVGDYAETVIESPEKQLEAQKAEYSRLSNMLEYARPEERDSIIKQRGIVVKEMNRLRDLIDLKKQRSI